MIYKESGLYLGPVVEGLSQDDISSETAKPELMSFVKDYDGNLQYLSRLLRVEDNDEDFSVDLPTLGHKELMRQNYTLFKTRVNNKVLQLALNPKGGIIERHPGVVAVACYPDPERSETEWLLMNGQVFFFNSFKDPSDRYRYIGATGVPDLSGTRLLANHFNYARDALLKFA